MEITRRALIVSSTTLPILVLPSCAGQRFSLVDAIRELLTLSSQRAFASLISQNGFFDSSIARIDLPDALGGARGNRVLAAIFNSDAFRSRLTHQVNRAAEQGAEIAAPLVANAILTVGIDNAANIIRGGPEAATLFLKERMGPALFTAMIPGIDRGLRVLDSQVVQEALRAATGIDFAGLRDDVSAKASNAIYRAIGREEAAIRANPHATNSPLLIGVLGLAKKI